MSVNEVSYVFMWIAIHASNTPQSAVNLLQHERGLPDHVYCSTACRELRADDKGSIHTCI